MDILDSNIIIYSIRPDAPASFEAIINDKPTYSRVSTLEVLGFTKITAGDEADLKKTLRWMVVEEITAEVIDRAVNLRQKKRISVPDSIIAATALLKNYRFVTRNVADFDWIEGLQIYNPFDTPLAPA
jgi:toxin FitB